MGKILSLKKPADFRKAYREGKRERSPHFFLYIRPNGLEIPRIGISVAKKHVKLATRRNRLRRVAKELLRKGLLENREGRDFIISSRASAAGQHINSIQEELRILMVNSIKAMTPRKT